MGQRKSLRFIRLNLAQDKENKSSYKSPRERKIFNPWTAQDSPRTHEGKILVQLQIINSTSSCVLLQLYLFQSLLFIVRENYFLFILKRTLFVIVLSRAAPGFLSC